VDNADTRLLEQYACEGVELHISCVNKLIRVIDANYGRLNNLICAEQALGTTNDNCRLEATCIVKKRLTLCSFRRFHAFNQSINQSIHL